MEKNKIITVKDNLPVFREKKYLTKAAQQAKNNNRDECADNCQPIRL